VAVKEIASTRVVKQRKDAGGHPHNENEDNPRAGH
jgi:hypothetical protein